MATTTKYTWALKYYIDDGWEMEVVERWIPTKPKPQTFDMYGFGDLYGFRGRDHLIVQVTDAQHEPEHLRAILAEPRAEKWARASRYNHIELITKNKRGIRKLGEIKVRVIIPSDFG